MNENEIVKGVVENMKEVVPEVVKEAVEEETKTFNEKAEKLEKMVWDIAEKVKLNTWKKEDKEDIQKNYVVKTFQKMFGSNMNIDEAKTEVKATFMNSTLADGEGSELVFDQFEKDIQRTIDEYPIISDVRVYNLIKGDGITIPKALNTLTTAWTAEGQKGILSKAGTGNILIQVKKAMSLVKISNELLADNMASPDVYKLLVEFMAESIASFLEEQLINGDGSGDNMLGLMVDSDIKDIALPTGKTKFSDIDDDTLIDAITFIEDKYLRTGEAKWYFSKYTLGQLMKLKTADGYPLYPELRGKNKTLLGAKVVTSVSLPWNLTATAQKGKPFILFGNLKHYTLVKRKDLTIEKGLSWEDFSSELVTIKGTQRVHGKKIFKEAFVRIKTANS